MSDFEPEKNNPVKDRDERIPTPRKCIKEYCLRLCEKKGRLNSKRDVVECTERLCPLHPYRTGMLKARSGPKNERAKMVVLARLEQARKWVDKGDKKLWEEREKLQRVRIEQSDKVLNFRDEQMKKMKEYNKKCADVISRQEEVVKEAESVLEERKKRVKKLETLYNDQLEAGHWLIREEEGDVDVFDECSEIDVESSDEG